MHYFKDDYTCECGRRLRVHKSDKYRVRVHKETIIHKKLMGQIDDKPSHYDCECGVRLRNLPKIRYNHKFSRTHREYCANHGIIIEKKIQETIICDCGSEIKKSSTSIKRHQKTKRHQSYLTGLHSAK